MCNIYFNYFSFFKIFNGGRAMPEGRSLQRLEIRSDKTNYGRYQEAAQGKCRGVPFFINSKTGNFVCGAAPCATLKERLL
jgi:hypothetical protein